MSKVDRLSALMARFELSVAHTDVEHANLLILGQPASDIPRSILLSVNHRAMDYVSSDIAVLFGARVSWGGADNPLLSALPDVVERPVNEDTDIGLLAELFLVEQKSSRCGSASVLNRLAEILTVNVLRYQLKYGETKTGLLAGLADQRLSKAIVAIHDNPSRDWCIERLSEEAGLSPSRFAELFRQQVGMPPLAYLRSWRLTLAKQDIERGERVQRVASKYGYNSTEALSRAFSKAFGFSPIHARKAAMANMVSEEVKPPALRSVRV